MKHLFLSGLLLWYIGFLILMGFHPVDPQNMIVANILPVLFVSVLVFSFRRIPFSFASYVLISIFFTLHTIGAHYTYEQVPFGIWLEDSFALPRNHFDRMVHFCFGLLLAYPLHELLGKFVGLSVWLRWYIVFMTLMGLAGLWEILESWGTRILHPELGLAYLGAQGDIWDAQKDMAATLYGALLWIAIMICARHFSGSRLIVPPEGTLDLPHVSNNCS